jgi:hypothetical protein
MQPLNAELCKTFAVDFESMKSEQHIICGNTQVSSVNETNIRDMSVIKE